MKHRSLKKRLLALATTVMTLVMCMAGTMSASAANTPVNGGTFTFNKYLVMDENANVPNVTFEFTIAAGTPVAASGSNPAIYAGDDLQYVNGSPIINNVNFNKDVVAYDVSQGNDNIQLNSGEKYAKQPVTVDFRNVSYKQFGIYRYIVTETASNAGDITNDSVNTRTLDVYVGYKDGSDTELEVMGYVLYATSTDGQLVKSSGFTNRYTTYVLTLAKDVTGNQGDRDKYFEFTVNITGAVEGTSYTVDLSNAEAELSVDGTTKTNPATLTATDGNVTATYYLKNGQSIEIQNLTKDMTYNITETNYTADGYTTSYVLDQGTSTTSNSTGTQTMNNNSHTVIFTNNKEGTVPTGILLETAPYVVLMLVVVAGGVALLAAKRKHSR